MGDKVGASEAALLNMLNISPFSYGLIIRQGKKHHRVTGESFSSDLVYDSGSCFEPAILDIKPADLRAKFSQGIQRLAAFSLGINYPNQASVTHLILGGFKRLLALAAETDVEFEQAKTVSIAVRIRFFFNSDLYLVKRILERSIEIRHSCTSQCSSNNG